MKRRGTGLAVLVLCVIGGLIAAIFTPAIAATLATPAAMASASPAAGATQTRPAAPTAAPVPTRAVTPAPTAQPTMPAGVTVLAQDSFQRNDQVHWGTASDHRTWSGDANNSPAFAIANKMGQVAGGQGQTAFQATLGDSSNDADLLISGSVSQFDANRVTNLGVILRWQDANNWYKALINGSQLQLLKDVGGKITVLAEHVFNATGDTQYSLRFRVQGSNLFARAWPSARPEPAQWTIMNVDTQFTRGLSGIRVKILPGVLIKIHMYLETSIPNM
ncbi:MAG TPA: hypothetical protein VF458_24335 [Ktedonobacteraceae bacterium]